MNALDRLVKDKPEAAKLLNEYMSAIVRCYKVRESIKLQEKEESGKSIPDGQLANTLHDLDQKRRTIHNQLLKILGCNNSETRCGSFKDCPYKICFLIEEAMEDLHKLFEAK